MPIGRRVLLASALARPALAQPAFPSRPIRLLVGSSNGGSQDITARLLASRMAPLLGQQVVVENRGGAGGALATEPVRLAPPDGHTLVFNNMGAFLVVPLLNGGPQPWQEMVPVSLVADVLTVLVCNAARSWLAVADLIAAARAAPGMLSWGHPGVGSSPWLAALLLDREAGIRTVEVPYRGGGPAMLDLLAGRLDFSFATTPTALPHVATGKFRALAVPTASRLPTLPGVPTMVESGFPGFALRSWFGVMAPAGTPPAVVALLNRTINQAMADPEVAAILAPHGEAPLYSTPEEFARIGMAEQALWGPLALAAARGQNTRP
jgi:tripartite-type tricarboxylate transporter receptor subunit TctC